MPAVGITDGPPPCARDHQAVVLSCSHLARRWVALERRSAWLVVDAQVKACSRETHNPIAGQLKHTDTMPLNNTHTHHCYQHRLRNDLKCVEWDVKPCSINQSFYYRPTTILVAICHCHESGRTLCLNYINIISYKFVINLAKSFEIIPLSIDVAYL